MADKSQQKELIAKEKELEKFENQLKRSFNNENYIIVEFLAKEAQESIAKSIIFTKVLKEQEAEEWLGEEIITATEESN